MGAAVCVLRCVWHLPCLYLRGRLGMIRSSATEMEAIFHEAAQGPSVYASLPDAHRYSTTVWLCVCTRHTKRKGTHATPKQKSQDREKEMLALPSRCRVHARGAKPFVSMARNCRPCPRGEPPEALVPCAPQQTLIPASACMQAGGGGARPRRPRLH